MRFFAVSVLAVLSLPGDLASAEAEKPPIGWKGCLSEKSEGRAEFCVNEILRLCRTFEFPKECISRVAHQWRMYDANLRVDESLRKERENGIKDSSRLNHHFIESRDLMQDYLDKCPDQDEECDLEHAIINAYKRWHE